MKDENNKKNIKIIFIDIDGTLVNNRKRITLKTRKAIKQVVDKGIYVVLTSGRDILHTIDKSKRALASNIIISSNGSEIYDYKNKKLIYKNNISTEKVYQIWDYCNKKQIGIMIKSFEGKLINKYLIGKDKENGIIITNKKELKNILVSQIIFISNDIELILNAKKFIKSLDLSVNHYSNSFLDASISDRYSLDINNKGVSKGAGIKKLLKHLNISKEESMCFGDYYNDLDMFKACNIKVAMENACNEIKKEADYITETNEKNGVANFLNKYFKEEK